MPRIVIRHIVDDAGLAGLLRPRSGIISEELVDADVSGGFSEAAVAYQDETATVATYRASAGPVEHYQRTVIVASAAVSKLPPPQPHQSQRSQQSPQSESSDKQYTVTETTTFRLAIPFFAPLFALPLRWHLKRAALASLSSQKAKTAAATTHTEAAANTEAAATSGKIPALVAQPWWAPPNQIDARASTVLGVLGLLAIVGGYLGTLITQTITFATESFGSTDTAQGFTLAAVRVGVVLALFITARSDRQGRRKLLLITAAAAVLLAATGALAPSLFWLGFSQTLARGLSTALALLIGIVAAEEMPAGSRAYAVSVMALAAGLGAGMCVWVLPVADLGPEAWRIIYLVPLVALPAIARAFRLLPESRRFESRASASDTIVVKKTKQGGIDAKRLSLLAVSGFLSSMFLAPASQFQNEFLRSERGFSASRITVFTLLTSTPAGIGVAAGGRLADTRGRKVVAAVALIGGAAFVIGSYLVPGWPLWALAAAGSIVGAATVPALGVYGPELFPTSARGKANGIITLVGVVGSAVGLLLVGQLSDWWGEIGPAIALVGVGPAILAVLILTRYPETAHRELEELNPEDARFLP